MRATAYVLFVIAIGLFMFVGINAMLFESEGVRTSPVSNIYMWALIPAGGALVAGIYMMLTQSKGYGRTNNPSIQETAWEA